VCRVRAVALLFYLFLYFYCVVNLRVIMFIFVDSKFLSSFSDTPWGQTYCAFCGVVLGFDWDVSMKQ